MDGPIITVDVSKGNCHYQPYSEKGRPLRKPKVLYDTKEGFEELSKTIAKTKEKSGSAEVSVVFEATGVYHRCLQKYLDDNGIPYFIISPLLSAKYRQIDLHANKTDALDCGHIARAYVKEEDGYAYLDLSCSGVTFYATVEAVPDRKIEIGNIVRALWWAELVV